ncbi:unnamed protein product [Linum tenue]|uniref:Beta-glucosidase n=2 Tax=Linum tenue TaxID=586396 RepID=A0AAV0K238_9ROSI|nr:unnamed protein product [Linum tenue]
MASRKIPNLPSYPSLSSSSSSSLVCNATVSASSSKASSLNSSHFPSHFMFGTASSAYQYEGGAREGGKGPSIWDTYTQTHQELVKDRSNGDVAVDSYNRYQEDIEIMKTMGFNAYRFSFAWSRLLPSNANLPSIVSPLYIYLFYSKVVGWISAGKLSGGVNKQGVDYYNNLIDSLLSNGMQPFVTLFHWDTPQGLEDEYGGFLSSNIVEDFEDYAEVCFREFGDRVKHWITFNEPWTFSSGGYAGGPLRIAPFRCSHWQLDDSTGGDSGTEPYVTAHHQLLAHAAAVNLYRLKYQATQNGVIGISNVSHWFLPLSDSKEDEEAAQRAVEFMYGWFMDPIFHGDYPEIMKSYIGSRLPQFSSHQSDLLKGSFDFIGLNYYTASYASNHPQFDPQRPCMFSDRRLKLSDERNGVLIGPRVGSGWVYDYPRGFEQLLNYTKTRYNDPVIYITENGVYDSTDESSPKEEALQDVSRVSYFQGHLEAVHNAIKKGVKVKGYFAWSLLDNFEWSAGYSLRFGLVHIDFKNGLQRHPKLSAFWFQNFLRQNRPIENSLNLSSQNLQLVDSTY